MTTYTKNDLYCLKCGKQTVYVEDSEGGYYEGPMHVCSSCRATFTAPWIGEMSEDNWLMRTKLNEQA